jgi:uncharacterized protein (DUF4415 family)
MSEGRTKVGKRVRFSLDPDAVPPITDEERKSLLKLSDEHADQPIDFSDVPATTETTWRHGVRGRFFRPVKQQVTLRLDSNTLDWFKRRTPKGYQTDINRVLAEYVAAQQKKAG